MANPLGAEALPRGGGNPFPRRRQSLFMVVPIRIDIDSSGAERKFKLTQQRLGAMQQDLLAQIGAAMEAGMKLAVTSGRNKALDTGKLRANIQFQLIGSGERAVVVSGVDRIAPYGKYVAVGTPTMKKRPFHTQAWKDMVEPRLDELAQRVVQSHTKDLR